MVDFFPSPAMIFESLRQRTTHVQHRNLTTPHRRIYYSALLLLLVLLSKLASTALPYSPTGAGAPDPEAAILRVNSFDLDQMADAQRTEVEVFGNSIFDDSDSEEAEQHRTNRREF